MKTWQKELQLLLNLPEEVKAKYIEFWGEVTTISMEN
jgi:hypothetical protein